MLQMPTRTIQQKNMLPQQMTYNKPQQNVHSAKDTMDSRDARKEKMTCRE